MTVVMVLLCGAVQCGVVRGDGDMMSVDGGVVACVPASNRLVVHVQPISNQRCSKKNL